MIFRPMGQALRNCRGDTHLCRPLSALLCVAVANGCVGEPPHRLPEPVWITESALVAAPAANGTWPGATWDLVAPESVGLSLSALRSIKTRVQDSLPDVRSVLIVKEGRIAYEEYFGDARASDPVNVKSVTKSVTSALVGIAIERGILPGLDTPVVQWLGDAVPASADPRVQHLTLRHVLEMRTGFEWQESGPSTLAWLQSADRVRFTLGSRMVAEPGAVFNYNTGASHLLSAVLDRAVGGDVRGFADSTLFGPVGMRAGPWAQDARGIREGGSELWLTARDMARFGLLYLRGGRWGDRQVIPNAWVLESTRPHGRVDYGLHWSYLPAEWGGPAVNALGYGGQLIAVVPWADAVVVMTSSTRDASNPVLELLRTGVLPALRGAGAPGRGAT